jgi:hypothetical protein
MKKEDKKHLYYLDELSDYKVDSHYSDVSGWPVKDREDRVIGKVSNLLVNKDLEKVVYLDVEVDDSIIEANHDPYATPANAGLREFVNKEGENHIIIPIGMVTIESKEKFVFADSIGYQTFAGTKRMIPGANINRDYEMTVLNSYNRDRKTRYDEDFERDPEYKTVSPPADRRREGNVGYKNEIDDVEKDREELKAERRNLEEERRHLEAERLALKEERRKLEAERKKHILDKDDTGNIGTEYEESSKLQNKENKYYEDDSFYNRREFDRSNDFD